MVNKKVLSWALFDFANSSYTTIIISAIFPIFFINTLAENSLWADKIWGINLFISYCFLLVLAPSLGALADRFGRKKQFLIYSSLLCVIPTFALYGFLGKSIYLTLACILVSNVGFGLSEVFIASFLPTLSTKSNIGKISGLGWAIGYVGGLLSLFFALFFLDRGGNEIQSYKNIAAMTAIFFLGASLPAFFNLKDQMKPFNNIGKDSLAGLKSLLLTLRTILNNSRLLPLFLTILFLGSAMTIVITFGGIFASRELHFSEKEVLSLFIVLNVSALIGSLSYGFLQDLLSAAKTLKINIAIWLLAIAFLFFVHTKTGFWFASVVIGASIGGTQSICRCLVSLHSPEDKQSEMFGFWIFFNKLASMLGIGLYTISIQLFDSHRMSIIVIEIFFLLSLASLSKLKTK